MKRPPAFRMFRETYHIYQSQVLRLEQLSHRTGLNKSELIRVSLEAFLRYHDLVDQEFRVLPGEIENEKAVEYGDVFMKPFVEMMDGSGKG